MHYFWVFERNTRQPYNLRLFRALALQLHGNKKLEKETSKIFKLSLKNSGERDASKIQGVHLNYIPKVEGLLQLHIFLYDLDFVDKELIDELCEKLLKVREIVKNLRYNKQICYINNINALFSAFHFTTFDTFFQWRGIWNDICLIVVIVLNIFTQKVFTT